MGSKLVALDHTSPSQGIKTIKFAPYSNFFTHLNVFNVDQQKISNFHLNRCLFRQIYSNITSSSE